MKLIEGPFADWPVPSGRAATTIGVYDGVHRGHQRVIADLGRRAAAEDLLLTVVTFRRHPAVVLAPDRVPPQITTLAQRLELLAGLDVDQVAILDFDETLRHQAPGDFVAQVLVAGLASAVVSVGADFRFGYRQSGDVAVLAQLGAVHGFEVVPVALVGESEPFSATRIRDALTRGDLNTAEALLGRSFELRGTVVAGDGRGRAIGVPTANLRLAPHQALPAHGVYAVRAGIGRPDRPAVANVGIRPTFNGSTTVVEVHLLDTDVDLYGVELHVEFVARIRDEQRFAGIDELVGQIRQDVSTARMLLGVSG